MTVPLKGYILFNSEDNWVPPELCVCVCVCVCVRVSEKRERERERETRVWPNILAKCSTLLLLLLTVQQFHF